jgi:hypothetical protein
MEVNIQLHILYRFTREEFTSPLVKIGKGAWWGPRAGLDAVGKESCSAGNRTRAFQSVAPRYTD